MSNNEKYELDEVDMKILRLLIDYKKISNIAIGEIVNLTNKQVGRRRKRPAFKKVLFEYLSKPIDIIVSAKPEAAIRLKRLTKSKDEKIAIKACELVLGDDLKEKSSDYKPIEIIIKRASDAAGNNN